MNWFQFYKKVLSPEPNWVELVRRNRQANAMAFLFLDFDGVFMSTNNDPVMLMKNIVTLIQEYDLQIVLSTSWRGSPELAKRTMEKMGCKSPIVGMTPKIPGPRVNEIGTYLREHAYSSFVILDDMDMGWLNEYAVKTTFSEGFTQAKLDEARTILNRQK